MMSVRSLQKIRKIKAKGKERNMKGDGGNGSEREKEKRVREGVADLDELSDGGDGCDGGAAIRPKAYKVGDLDHTHIRRELRK